MMSKPASKKPESDKRAYRRQDPERRRGERKWFDPAMRHENHAVLARPARRADGERQDR
jgi:hypothetical protein